MVIATKTDSVQEPLSAKQDLEQRILDSPEVQSLLDKLARKRLELGRNPIPACFHEQFTHLQHHFLEFIVKRRSLEHPELKYETPERFFKESGRYFSRRVLHGINHLRSFFSGKDYIEPLQSNGHNPIREQINHALYHIGSFLAGEDGHGHPEIHYPALNSSLKASGSYLLGWTKSFFSSAKNLGKHFLMIGKHVSYDAKRMSLEAKAREFASSVSSVREPEFVKRTNGQAARFVKNSFSRVIVTGLEDMLESGRTVADYLCDGGVIIFRNHQSYSGFVGDRVVYAKHGIDNMTFIAGSNIVNLNDRKKAAEWRELLTHSGVKLVERNPPKGKDGSLYFTVLGKSIELDLLEGGNTTIFGNGREDSSKEWALKTALMPYFLEHGKFVLPAAESHEIILDDYELAHAAGKKLRKGSRPSFDTLFSLERSPERGEEPCGEFYLNFGKPIPTSTYPYLSMTKEGKLKPNKSLMRKCEEDLKGLTTQLVTLSSTYLLALLAADLKNNGVESFGVGQATDLVGSLLEKIHGRNRQYVESNVGTSVFIAPKLTAGNLSDVVLDAAEKLASRGALEKSDGIYSVGDPVMLDFYAAKGEPPLMAHGIIPAEKKA